MDPSVGYMDGENIPNVIVRDIVPVLDLCIGQDVCHSILMEVHISNIIEGSGSVAVSCSAAWVDVNGFVWGLDFCEERAVAKHVHRALVIEENITWV